ncbi:outer membrane protein assembly factor BamE [Cobetia sp. L2A1]|uniref:outer membrane protein assembly factor BamE n=1 Tax=Cobetia sp. L2A1 TaxID=2686360 RepID=UPI00131EB101|nr:outer membrane protein assembly factor BamE [Cobetia sp. L2A1]
MQNLIKTVAFCSALALLSGCSYFGVYKRDLPQGNLIKPEMVEQLKPGMSREQVIYVMGSPLLTAPFNESSWDYVYRLKKADGDIINKRVTLTFDGDALSTITPSGEIGQETVIVPDLDIDPRAAQPNRADSKGGAADLPDER